MAGIAIDTQEQGGVGIRQRSSRSGVTNPGTASHVLWGNIIGTLADQADLKAELDGIWKYAKKNRKLAKAAL